MTKTIVLSVYRPTDGLVFANYNANSGQITVANILSKGATIKEIILEELW